MENNRHRILPVPADDANGPRAKAPGTPANPIEADEEGCETRNSQH